MTFSCSVGSGSPNVWSTAWVPEKMEAALVILLTPRTVYLIFLE